MRTDGALVADVEHERRLAAERKGGEHRALRKKNGGRAAALEHALGHLLPAVLAYCG